MLQTAQRNASNADLRDRSTHTGTQPIETVEGITDALGNINANTVITDELSLDLSGERFVVSVGGTDSESSGYRALRIPNATGTPSYGSFSITSGNISIPEVTGTTTVTVARSGGNSGANDVTITVTAGLTTVSSTVLSWADGAGGSKSYTFTAADIAGPGNEAGTVSIAVTSGSAGLGTNSVTMTVTYDAPETPGDVNINSTFPIGQSGTTFQVYAQRSGGTTGAIAADWACSPAGLTTPQSGTTTWADGNSTDNYITLTRNSVTCRRSGRL